MTNVTYVEPVLPKCYETWSKGLHLERYSGEEHATAEIKSGTWDLSKQKVERLHLEAVADLKARALQNRAPGCSPLELAGFLWNLLIVIPRACFLSFGSTVKARNLLALIQGPFSDS